jgi:hypothetical protein
VSDLSTRPVPVPVRDDQGRLTNPPGWSQVILADAETVVCAWDDTGTFHQWWNTETLVSELIDALAMTQQALTEVTR